MKVLLIQAYLGRRELPVFPLGLAYLASNLTDHEVRIFDPNVAGDPYTDLAGQIEDFDPDVIGISLRNIDTTQYGDPFYYFKTLRPTITLIKRLNQRAPLVIGGPAFSIFAEKIMTRLTELDFGVYLDGEESFPELLDNLETPASVKGIYYRENGVVKYSGHRQMTVFIWSLKPRWELLDLHKYDAPESIGVLSKKGCSLKCIYCVYPFLTGMVQRLRPPESVVDEIEELVTKWGVKQFIFADSVFALPKPHAVAICREIIKRGLKVKWTGYFNEKFADQEFLDLAKAAGCVCFEFSSDGFTDRALQILRKPFTLAEVKRTFRLAQDCTDAEMKFFFFANPPGQTLSSFLELMWLFSKTKFARLRSRTYQIFVNVPRLLPNTELYDIAVAEGSIDRNIDLLPRGEHLPLALFYSNKQLRLAEAIFNSMHIIKNIVKKIFYYVRLAGKRNKD